MARVLICEPQPDVRSLLASVVRRIGHEPVVSDGSREQVLGVDAILLEPGADGGVELAAWAREQAPLLPLVCTSIFPPSSETDALGPDAYLLKPFRVHELEHALVRALERRK